MNTNALLAIMKLHGDRQADLAKALGLSLKCVNSKIHNRGGADFTRDEVEKIMRRYGMTAQDVEDVFFSSECLKKGQEA